MGEKGKGRAGKGREGKEGNERGEGTEGRRAAALGLARPVLTITEISDHDCRQSGSSRASLHGGGASHPRPGD